VQCHITTAHFNGNFDTDNQIYFIIKPTRCTNFTNYFAMKLHMYRTVRLSIIMCLFTVHSAMVYVIQVCRQLWSRTTMGLSPIVVLFALGKRKIGLVRGQENKMAGLSSRPWDPPEALHYHDPMSRALSCKRKHLTFSRNCGPSLEIRFKNFSKIFTWNSLSTFCPANANSLIVPCLVKS